jgi:hypothetical protein
VVTRGLHWSLSRARSIQSIPPHPISLRFILLLSTHLVLGLPSGSFLLAFPPIFYMHSSSPPVMYVKGEGPCTVTYSCLLCFPFYSSPHQMDLMETDCGLVKHNTSVKTSGFMGNIHQWQA